MFLQSTAYIPTFSFNQQQTLFASSRALPYLHTSRVFTSASSTVTNQQTSQSLRSTRHRLTEVYCTYYISSLALASANTSPHISISKSKFQDPARRESIFCPTDQWSRSCKSWGNSVQDGPTNTGERAFIGDQLPNPIHPAFAATLI